MQVKSKAVAVLMTFVLAVSLCPVPAFAAPLTVSNTVLETQAVKHTQDEAVAWARAQIGKWLDYDHVAGCQCVDVTKYYYDYLGVGARNGNGYAYASGNCPSGWQRVKSPQPGDVATWAAYKGVARENGHVAIVVSVSGSSFTAVEQSGNTTACKYSTYASNNPSSFLRPDWPSARRTVSIAPGSYMIKSRIGNRAIDVESAKSDNGVNARIWQPLGSASQIFNVGWNDVIKGNYMQLTASGKFLDSANGAGEVNVWQWEGNGTKAQNWIFEDAGDGYVYVRNLHGYYLDVKNGEDRNGANVQVHAFNGSDAQKWRFIPISGKVKTRIEDGQYAVRSKIGGRVIDVDSAKTTNKANAQLWQPLGNAAQIFNVGWNSVLESNFIQLAASEKFLDASGADAAANVYQYEGNGGWAQNWFFEDAGDGYYYIRNIFGYYLDVKDGKNANGTNLQSWTFNGSDAQKWKLCKLSGKARTKVEYGVHAVQTKLGDYVLDVENASDANYANIALAEPTGGASQTFNIGWNDIIESNFMELASTGKFADASVTDGAANVCQYEGNGGFAQNWFFEDTGDGCYFVRNLYGYYLTVDGNRAVAGQNVSVAAFTGEDAQKWKLVGPIAQVPDPDADDQDDENQDDEGNAGTDESGTGDGPGKVAVDDSDSPAEGDDPATEKDDPAEGNEGAEPAGEEPSPTEKTDIALASISGLKAKTYTGKALVQNPVVKMGGATLEAGRDYTVSYKKNVSAGIATVIVKGTGNYTGKKTGTFTIAKAAMKRATVTKVSDRKYSGTVIKPNPKIAYKGKKLKKGTDYTLSYKNNKKPGKASIVVKGKGNFEGSKTVTFKIRKA